MYYKVHGSKLEFHLESKEIQPNNILMLSKNIYKYAGGRDSAQRYMNAGHKQENPLRMHCVEMSSHL